MRRSRQLLSERVAAPVLLAKIRSPSRELGRATLGRKGDARRDEQRGVAVVLSPGVAEDPLSSLLRCDAHRVQGGVAVRVGQGDAGAHALDQRHDGWCPQSWLVLLVRHRKGRQRISARRLEFRHRRAADCPGLAALRWLVRGYGYEVTSVDVRAAYSHTLTAAANAGVDGAVRTRIRALFDDPATRSGFVASVIGKELGLD